jgi:hypothetical protein
MSDETIKIRLTRWDPVTQVQWDNFCLGNGLELGENGWFSGDGLQAGCERDTATFSGPGAAAVAVAFWARFGGRMSADGGLDEAIDGTLRARPCMMSPEKVHLTSFGWGRKLQTWVAWTREEAVPLRALVGCTVNFGTKDGLAYESTIVTAFDGGKGIFTVQGGRSGSVIRRGEPAIVDGPEQVLADDIARGYIHPVAVTA